jgi:hypothetical protein
MANKRAAPKSSVTPSEFAQCLACRTDEEWHAIYVHEITTRWQHLFKEKDFADACRTECNCPPSKWRKATWKQLRELNTAMFNLVETAKERNKELKL